MLLESLDRKHVDTLDILSLVDEDKIKPYVCFVCYSMTWILPHNFDRPTLL